MTKTILKNNDDKQLQKRVDELYMKAYVYKQKMDEQRKELIDEARELIKIIGVDSFNTLDDNFARKLFNYPQDISFHRIHNIFSQVDVKKMKVENIIEKL